MGIRRVKWRIFGAGVVAKILALYGHDVKFIRKSNRDREHSADAYVDGEKWEFKTPKSKFLAAVERNLRRAKNQSSRIVLH